MATIGRLISPPAGLKLTSIEPLSGPRTVGSAGTQSTSGYIQTTAAAFGLWRFRFSFPPMRGAMFRDYRRWITALHGGANATRWMLYDPDMPTAYELGLDAPEGVDWPSLPAMPWSNGETWSNGMGWAATPPVVACSAATALDGTIVNLANTTWGHILAGGEYLGFFPFHLGSYMVTEVIADGEYRVWPPLRKALTTDSYATLRPTLALRLESESAATAGRGLAVADGLEATFIETLDYDVRDYFAG